MKIELKQYAQAGVLAGSDTGRQVLAKLLVLASREPERPELLFLDFRGVEVATASFLREAIIAFRNAVRTRKSNFYPVVANADTLVEDELTVLMKSLGQAIMSCSLTGTVQPKRIAVLGDLEPKQRITFALVGSYGETDAAALMREQNEPVGQTAWNNRLANLAELGLIVELSQGRSKRYRKLFIGS